MKALLERPHAFSLFQLIRLLEGYAGGARLGHQGPASAEAVRLCPELSLSFPAADVQAIEADSLAESGRHRFRITTSFMGLCSSDSPLPNFYTEELLWNETTQQAVRDFLDIFHHRALSLLYRSWQKYRYAIQFDRQGEDPCSQRIYCLIGLGSAALRGSSGLAAVRLLRYAGLVTQKPRSATSLAAIVRDYLDLHAVEIEQCVERWVDIDPEQQNRLGARNSTLGRDAHLGARVRDNAGKFRIRIGPVDYPAFARLLPFSGGYAALVNLTRFLIGDWLDFDMEVILKASDVPRVRLSSVSPSYLGWTSWLEPRPDRDRRVIFRQPREQRPQPAFEPEFFRAAGAEAHETGHETMSRGL